MRTWITRPGLVFGFSRRPPKALVPLLDVPSPHIPDISVWRWCIHAPFFAGYSHKNGTRALGPSTLQTGDGQWLSTFLQENIVHLIVHLKEAIEGV